MTTPTHKVYILRSLKTNRFYTGCTDNPDRRLEFHNSGTTPSTKSGIPWQLIWTSELMEKPLAAALELKIKKRGAGRFLRDSGFDF